MSAITLDETKPVEEMLAERDAAIAKALTEIDNIEEARGRGDKAAVQSAGGRLANRVREIRELELALASEGADFGEPWEKPTTSRSRKQEIPQEQIEANLEKLGNVYRTTPYESVKASADQRIQALLKAAKARGYQVQDPRPKRK